MNGVYLSIPNLANRQNSSARMFYKREPPVSVPAVNAHEQAAGVAPCRRVVIDQAPAARIVGAQIAVPLADVDEDAAATLYWTVQLQVHVQVPPTPGSGHTGQTGQSGHGSPGPATSLSITSSQVLSFDRTAYHGLPFVNSAISLPQAWNVTDTRCQESYTSKISLPQMVVSSQFCEDPHGFAQTMAR